MKSKVEHATIHHNKGDVRIKELIPIVKKAERKNESYWERECPKYNIKVVYSPEEYDLICNLKNVEVIHRVGMTLSNKTLVIFFEGFDQVHYSLESFLFHELNHIFYIGLVGDGKPFWLFEGIATYLMGDYKFKRKTWINHFRSIDNLDKFLYYSFNPKTYYKDPDSFIILSYLIYEYLHKNYGKKKILELLHKFSKKRTKNEFYLLFQKTFNKNIKEIISESLK